MKTKFEVIFAALVVFAMSPCVFASIQNLPDISAFNWSMGDDFSNINYTYNNWEKNIPSSITFAMNTSYQYGFLKAPKTS